MNLLDRIKAPTPQFFRKLRNIGITLATLGGVLLASPVALPAMAVTIGGYMVTAGGVLTAVSQSVTTQENENAGGGS